MPSSPARGPLTTRLLQELEATNFPVGDNTNPKSQYGWNGEPNDKNKEFTPWLTLTPMAGSPQRIPGALGDTGTEWRFPYMVFLAGVTRKQTEALADRIRAALTNIERENVDSETGKWRIQKVSCTAIGSTNKVGSAYPDYFTQSDSYEVWITKGK